MIKKNPFNIISKTTLVRTKVNKPTLIKINKQKAIPIIPKEIENITIISNTETKVLELTRNYYLLLIQRKIIPQPYELDIVKEISRIIIEKVGDKYEGKILKMLLEYNKKYNSEVTFRKISWIKQLYNLREIIMNLFHEESAPKNKDDSIYHTLMTPLKKAYKYNNKKE